MAVPCIVDANARVRFPVSAMDVSKLINCLIKGNNIVLLVCYNSLQQGEQFLASLHLPYPYIEFEKVANMKSILTKTYVTVMEQVTKITTNNKLIILCRCPVLEYPYIDVSRVYKIDKTKKYVWTPYTVAKYERLVKNTPYMTKIKMLYTKYGMSMLKYYGLAIQMNLKKP